MQPVSFPGFAACSQRWPRLLLGLRFHLTKKPSTCPRHEGAWSVTQDHHELELPYRQTIDRARNDHLVLGVEDWALISNL